MNFFAHDKVRDSQEKLIEDIRTAITGHRPILCHAPTGLGKTAAALAPALEQAFEKNLTVFFLTSRHTQHKIVMDTLRKISEKSGHRIIATSIIGKKWMCIQPGIETLSSYDFTEYCKTLREGGRCEFYTNTKDSAGKFTVQAKASCSDLIDRSPIDSTHIFDEGQEKKLCPYEMAIGLAEQAKVVVCDYYYVFHPQISQNFFNKTNKSLDKSIIIVDEGHNLPDRMRDLASSSLSSIGLSFAIKEASKYNLNEAHNYCLEIDDILRKLATSEEKKISKGDFLDKLTKVGDIYEIIETLGVGAEFVRDTQKRSALSGVAMFLEAWLEDDAGFTRYIERKETAKGLVITLKFVCLDPSIIVRPIVDNAYSTVVMSGTLTPTSMYADVMGIPKAIQKEYDSPFDIRNRLTLIVPRTTTKYSQRSPEQFKRISSLISEIANNVPGNTAIFFPSYALRDLVYQNFATECEKTCFLEMSGMTKAERQEILDKMKSYQKQGAVLLAAASGSFGEGIDLPGDLLKAVIIVGLPLARPDLPTNELIKYYDDLFSKGWDYGYVLPALTKTFQNAGRCIRTETDRGLIVFVDERYSWPRYLSTFPHDWELKIKVDFVPEIQDFFNNQYTKK